MKRFILNPITLSIFGLATLPFGIIAILALYVICATASPIEFFIQPKEMELDLEAYA